MASAVALATVAAVIKDLVDSTLLAVNDADRKHDIHVGDIATAHAGIGFDHVTTAQERGILHYILNTKSSPKQTHPHWPGDVLNLLSGQPSKQSGNGGTSLSLFCLSAAETGRSHVVATGAGAPGHGTW